jgi:hypothetical protein
MKDSRFYHFLQALSSKELKRFRKYMESPYFVTHDKIFGLFEIFERHLLSQSNDPIIKERVWEELYPERVFDYDFLRKLLHQLMEIGYDFLSQQMFEENIPQKMHSALQMLSQKQMTEFFEPAIRMGMNHLKKQFTRSGIYYYDLYSIQKFHYILENIESERVQKINIKKLNLIDIDKYLNIFYFAEKLKYYCLILSWSKLTKLDRNVPLITEIVHEIHKSDYSEIPAIAMYYQIYLTFIEPEKEEHFIQLKEIIKKNIHLFPAEEAKDIMNSAINYTIQKHNSGKFSYYSENFYLYKEALEKEIILINGELSPWAFKNIVTLALRLGEFAWVEDFIESYGNKINLEYRENAINYNKASLHFYRKQYDKAIPLLQKVQFDEVNYGLAVKSSLLMNFYELNELETLNSFFHSFRLYLNRNKSITDERRKSYLQLVKFAKKLTESQNDDAKLLKVKIEIENSQAMSKKWLLEKVDELLK